MTLNHKLANLTRYRRDKIAARRVELEREIMERESNEHLPEVTPEYTPEVTPEFYGNESGGEYQQKHGS